MDNQKKIGAAIAAVTYYIQEEAILMQQAAMGGLPQAPSASAPTPTSSNWSMNGRQTQMQMRNLMQMRTFQRGSRL